MNNYPSKLRNMSKRRRKIAIRRMLNAALQKYLCKLDMSGPLVRADIVKVILDNSGPVAHLRLEPRVPFEFVNLDYITVPVTIEKPQCH
jgi:hypothetical protein